MPPQVRHSPIHPSPACMLLGLPSVPGGTTSLQRTLLVSSSCPTARVDVRIRRSPRAGLRNLFVVLALPALRLWKECHCHCSYVLLRFSALRARQLAYAIQLTPLSDRLPNEPIHRAYRRCNGGGGGGGGVKCRGGAGSGF
jgi:hypothetical protein